MNANDPSDDELVLRGKSGDAPAFAVLSERHRANLVRMATLLVGDPDEAESIAQEALARALAGISTYVDRIILLNHSVVAEGEPGEVLSNEKILHTFGPSLWNISALPTLSSPKEDL